MIEIIPSIIATTKEELEAGIKRYDGHVERVHLDIMDGVFTSGKTILEYIELESIQTTLHFDVHLMVMHPEEYIPQWLKIANTERIFIHAEAQGELKMFLEEIKAQGRKAGLVLNPETPIDSIVECLPMVDYVQFMTVHPGSYSRAFLTDVVDKVLNFHDRYPDITIAIDGGMTPETAKFAYGAGASILVSGSYLLNAPDLDKALIELKNGFT